MTVEKSCRIPPVLFLTVALFLAALSSQAMGQMKMEAPMKGMAGMAKAPQDTPSPPPVKAFLEGRVVYFIHTEVSDPAVGKILTDMMGGSPVLVVPSLAMAPDGMVANVFAFKNGLKKGDGPFGFTADVFDSPPGQPGYSPLRRVNLVYWKEGAAARELKSVREVMAAKEAGEISIEKTGIVANMPLLTWPGGTR